MRLLALPDMLRFASACDGLGTHDAVGCETGVALELPDGSLGERAEDRVYVAAGETQRVQRLLHRADVAAVEVRHAQVQHAVAEGECRVDQRGPRRISDDPVLGEAVFVLERLDRFPRAAEEHAVDAGATEVVPEHEQAALYVLNSGTPVTGAHRLHRGNALRDLAAPGSVSASAVAAAEAIDAALHAGVMRTAGPEESRDLEVVHRVGVVAVAGRVAGAV